MKPETLFISDLHLSAERPQAIELFLRFTRDRARQVEALYILGDLFDAWIGDDDDGALAVAVRGALHDLTAAGVSVFFQGGNRDFLIGTRFAERTGVRLLPDFAVMDLSGTPTLLTHGDLLNAPTTSTTSKPGSCSATRTGERHNGDGVGDDEALCVTFRKGPQGLERFECHQNIGFAIGYGRTEGIAYHHR